MNRWAFAEWVVLLQPGNQALSHPHPHPPARPFRKLDEKGSLHWDRITRLEKGKIYRQVRTI